MYLNYLELGKMNVFDEVYVTNRQLHVFRDELQRIHDSQWYGVEANVLLTDMLYNIEDELDKRDRLRNNSYNVSPASQ